MNKERLQGFVKKATLFIWQKLKESIFFAGIKAFLLIFVLIYIIFSIKPEQAHVSAIISELGYTEAIADKVILKDYDCDHIGFYCKDAVRMKVFPFFEFDVIGVNPDYYKNTYSISIYPGAKGYSSFSIQGQTSDLEFKNALISDWVHYSSDKVNINCVGKQYLTVSEGRIIFESSDEEIIREFDTSDYSKKLDLFSMYIDGCTVEPDINGRDKYSIILWNISEEHAIRSISTMLRHNGVNIEATGVSSLDSTVTGKLAVSYTPNPQNYDLNMQDLGLVSSNSSEDMHLKCSVKYNADDDSYKTEGVLYGYISEGEISKMTLFPSFKTWFYSNAYMTPTAIITIVLTAIALFNKKKEDGKD